MENSTESLEHIVISPAVTISGMESEWYYGIIFSAMLMFVMYKSVMILIWIALYITVLFKVAREVAKKDRLMTKVYLRYIRYEDRYEGSGDIEC